MEAFNANHPGTRDKPEDSLWRKVSVDVACLVTPEPSGGSRHPLNTCCGQTASSRPHRKLNTTVQVHFGAKIGPNTTLGYKRVGFDLESRSLPGLLPRLWTLGLATESKVSWPNFLCHTYVKMTPNVISESERSLYRQADGPVSDSIGCQIISVCFRQREKKSFADFSEEFWRIYLFFFF